MPLDIPFGGLQTGSNGTQFWGGFSLVVIMAVLCKSVMLVNPANPLWPVRDRFILSKGYIAIEYYAPFEQAGLVTDEEYMTFKSNHTFLYGNSL